MKRYFNLGLCLLAAYGIVLAFTLALSQFMPSIKEIEPAAQVLLDMGSL